MIPFKVLFVVTSLNIGGAERQLSHLLRHLSQSDFKPVVVCLKEKGPLAQEVSAMGIPVYDQLLANKYDVRVLGKLISIIKKERPHILWTRSTGDKMFWGRLAAKLAGVPIILASIHFMGEKGQARTIIGGLNKTLTPITDRFIAVSENQKRYLIEDEGLPAEKMVVIYNGIEWRTFLPQRSRSEMRKALGIPEKGWVIGQVAKLRSEKGHRIFLSAAQKVLQKRQDVIFLIIGDGPERKDLEAYSKKIHPGQAIRFLGDRQDLPDLLNAIDLGTLSSTMETFPNALLEYMAFALPVVAPNVGGIPEIIRDGVDGFLFPPGDADRMAYQLLSLLSNPDKAEEMGQEGLKRVKDSFSMEGNVGKIETLLHSLLSDKGVG